MPSYVAHLYRTRLLGRTEERQLFCRMNYLKHRAHSLLEHLKVSDPCVSSIRQIESLLDEARTIRDAIIEANLRLVVSIAKRLVDRFNTLDDLVSEGNVALMRAVEKFDFGRGFCFSTYATYAIRNSIYRAVNHGRNRRSRELERSDEALELATDVDAEGRSREREVDALKAAFATMLGRLDPREREIIQARFAMGGRTKPQTLAQIGEEFGVCKERVRQLQIRALRKLRAAATSRFAHVVEDPLIG